MEIPGSEFSIKVDLVLLAMGFVHPEHNQMVTGLGLELDSRGNIKTDEEYATNKEGIFTAGDSQTGASLVVRAINHGLRAGKAVDRYLKK